MKHELQGAVKLEKENEKLGMERRLLKSCILFCNQVDMRFGFIAKH